MEIVHNFLLNFRLAYRNIISAGLRTWLTITTLAFAFLLILFFNSLYTGWEYQGIRDQIDWEYADGQIIQTDYDKLDPFSIESGHSQILDQPQLTPVLIRQGNLYPQGRLLPILIKGIPADQQVVKLPTSSFLQSKDDIPAIIGDGMATDNHLKIGDKILLRWKDKNGTFDAKQITIVDIFKTNVPTVDGGQIWVDINTLWEMTGMQNEVTYHLVKGTFEDELSDQWRFEIQQELLKEFVAMVDMKKGSSAFLYIILMFIALIAIFDSQVFSVFKRQKEIGTYIALGFTKKRVTFLFTLEGTMYAFIATIIGTAISVPLITWLGVEGVDLGNQDQSRQMGVTVGEKLYPMLTSGLLFSSVFWVILLSTIVSYLPVRKIAKMNTVDALKGKK
ncbi:FtsX-like permease family protein [Flammeovirga yaeyamensis]|uniref:FtsX-like permease family protein n=1 Tax=Flammeovirga yaeyamensis TaxID=367791 RepID=A0AAX1N9N2_9BACT|nr:FtsX-like permease family protein [Flammeovirga yaeyamensis]MBB3699298.1 ABC-type lipoprotein release transport system permease subunit [Flammeovirga yaeyamensis]NMF35439.1 ABC transporter permease [Flammeovirga yaeyamensis]QWG04299.1 FtsX-like permease family protein [Flammeovirga yaeyamensis]